MKQFNLFGADFIENKEDDKYTKKIKAPIYEPKNKQPHILELVDAQKTKRMISQINSSTVSVEEKAFLTEAAKRHTVFNYSKVADYYASASKEMQYLMERSALVIIDFQQAIQLGYVKLNENITQQYLNEYDDE